jgi:hypothetical protein
MAIWCHGGRGLLMAYCLVTGACNDMPIFQRKILPSKYHVPTSYIYIAAYSGAHGSVVVKALCYKPEGCGFETR